MIISLYKIYHRLHKGKTDDIKIFMFLTTSIKIMTAIGIIIVQV